MELNRKPLCEIDKGNKTLTILATGEKVPMRDLTKHVAFHVRQSHIKLGIPRDPCGCTISRAIKHATNAELVVTLSSLVIFVVREGKGKVAYRGSHSALSKSLLRMNDLRLAMKEPPGHFFIQPPSETASLRATKRFNRTIRKSYRERQEHPNQPRVKRNKIEGVRSGTGHRLF